MRLWVDLANAPHVTLFAPMIPLLEERGWAIVTTVWRRGQTGALADLHLPGATSVDEGGFRRSRVAKARGVWNRTSRLPAAVQPPRPDVALGHNSYSQLVAARRMRLPSVTMMDYEHQPANHLAFRLATRVLLPEAIPLRAVRRYGATAAKTAHYAGVKEHLTLSGFAPDPGFRQRLQLDGRLVVTVRPAAEGALYHRHANSAFDDLLHSLRHDPEVQLMLSPRTAGQAERYSHLEGVRVLREAVDGPNLLFHSDAFVGAGGTMTREAAVLGTPTYSVFEGAPAAVDRWLEARGLMRPLTSAADVLVAARASRLRPPPEPRLPSFVSLLDAELRRAAHGAAGCSAPPTSS